MKRRILDLILLLSVSLVFGNASFAAMAEKIILVGKIVGFDEKTVQLKSGNSIYTFLKSDLMFPSYKTGDEIKIEIEREKLKQLKSRAAK